MNNEVYLKENMKISDNHPKKDKKSSNRDNLKVMGWVLFGIGALMLCAGISQDTTVTGRTVFDRTHNIGKISDRETTTLVGGFLMVSGSIFVNRKSDKKNEENNI